MRVLARSPSLVDMPIFLESPHKIPHIRGTAPLAVTPGFGSGEGAYQDTSLPIFF
jgi:hypothetical protein